MDAPRMRRSVPVLVVAVILALSACSGGPASVPPDASTTLAPGATGTPTPPPSAPPSPSPAAFPLTITDDEGTTLTLSARPERVVSLTPAVTETLFAIGAGDRVVAKVEDIADYPPEAADLPVVATFEGVDVEQIVALEADLVIAGGADFNQVDGIGRLRDAGIPVLVVAATSMEGALRDIDLIGRAVGRSEAATTLTAAMRNDFDTVAAAARGLEKSRVLYEVSYADGKLYTVPEKSIYAEMLALAGADPVTTDASYLIALEKVLVFDPEIILLDDAAFGVTPAEVAARPGWDVMTAVSDGAIRPVNGVVVTRPGPRLAEGLRGLAIAVHPELEATLGAGSPAAPSPAPSPSS